MDLTFVLLIGLVAFGIAVYAAVRRRPVLAAVAAVAALVSGVVWVGETVGFLNV